MMRFGTARSGGRKLVVAQRSDEQKFVDITRLCSDVARVETLDDLLDASDEDLRKCIQRARAAPTALSQGDLALLPPLMRPSRIRDCSIVTAHLKPASDEMRRRLAEDGSPGAAEAGAHFDDLLTHRGNRGFGWGERDVDTISGPGDEITNPGGELDIELELAGVVRRNSHGEPEIFGYTLYNDWTLRDRQLRNWVASRNLHGDAKNFPGANTFGPMVLLADDCPDPSRLFLRAEVNGTPVAEGGIAGAPWTFQDALVPLFAKDKLAGHELIGSGTILGGSLFEQGERLPRDATVRLICDDIGILENTVKG